MFLQYGWCSLPSRLFSSITNTTLKGYAMSSRMFQTELSWGEYCLFTPPQFLGWGQSTFVQTKGRDYPQPFIFNFTFSAYYSASSSLRVTSAWYEKASRREYKHHSPSNALRLSSYSLRCLSSFSSCKNFLEANFYPSSIPNT